MEKFPQIFEATNSFDLSTKSKRNRRNAADTNETVD